MQVTGASARGGFNLARVQMPTVDQVRELPELVRHVVPSSWDDMAGYPFMDMMGISAEYVRDSRVGMFDLEHHIWFLDEMHVGDVVTGHACLVARGPKRVLSVMFIIDETRNRLASVLEVISTTADLDARRTMAIPEPLAIRIDELIAEQNSRSWKAPSSGSLIV